MPQHPYLYVQIGLPAVYTLAENGESESPSSAGMAVDSGHRNFRCLLSSLAKAVAFSTGALWDHT